jgi:hypothetical protein
MNEEPKSIWKKSWKGPGGLWLWFVLLVAAAFVVILCVGLASGRDNPTGRLVFFAFLYAIGFAIVGVLVVGFIKWVCCWRNFRRFLFGLACFATLVALFYAEENWRGQRAWEKYRRTWEAKGEKFDLASLAPPSVPDEQNFAMTPLLKPAFDFIRTNNGVVWLNTNARARLENSSMEMVASFNDTNKLTLGSLEQGTLADLEASANFYRGNTNYPQPAQAGSAAETILAALGKYDAELAELTEAAATRPRSRFPIEYDYEMPAAILLPHLAPVKKFCLATQLRAIARLEQGQSAEAFADLQLGFRLSDSVRDEPILISHLVRLAMLGFDLQTVREGMERQAWSEEQLLVIEKYLASVNLFTESKNAMRGERALGVGCIEWARRQGFKFDMNQIDGDAALFARVANFMPRGWLYQNMLAISQMHQDFTIATADENNRLVLSEVVEAGDAAIAELASGRMRPYKVFAALFFPAINKAVIRSARMQTHVDATRVACALERYRLTNGQLPEKLGALVPRFLAAVPGDVMDGQPLRYHPTPGGGYVLYSIGWNKTDDHGELAWSKKEKQSTVDANNGDWVWKFPVK